MTFVYEPKSMSEHELRQALQQRDQLLAALEDLLEVFGGHAEGECPAEDRARAAIAQAKGRVNMGTNPYKNLLLMGCEIDSHESDLYVRATPQALAIVRQSGWSYKPFYSRIDGQLWLDVPFAYEPFWERRQSSLCADTCK
jgi:hypothetical protein